MTRDRCGWFGVITLLAAWLLSAWPVSAQQAAIHYVYDDLGRLTAVVDQEGNVGTYTYDAVGNLLGVGRVNAADQPGAVAITLVGPENAPTGAQVEIFGKGFSATPSENTVLFDGVAASVLEAAPNRLLVVVPAGATTGSITVTAPLGSATSPSPFGVVGVLSVSPGAVSVRPPRRLRSPRRTSSFRPERPTPSRSTSQARTSRSGPRCS